MSTKNTFFNLSTLLRASSLPRLFLVKTNCALRARTWAAKHPGRVHVVLAGLGGAPTP